MFWCQGVKHLGLTFADNAVEFYLSNLAVMKVYKNVLCIMTWKKYHIVASFGGGDLQFIVW